MDKKELKSVIKQLVRESLVEIFAEMHLENIVENVVKSQLKTEVVKKQRTPLVEIDRPKQTAPLKRPKLVEETTSDVWRSIYEDTLNSSNPVLTEKKGDENTNPELVPERILEQAGLMRDYSKLAGLSDDDDDKSSQEDEWTKIRKEREKVLKSVIKM